jgi:hypothetical protein
LKKARTQTLHRRCRRLDGLAMDSIKRVARTRHKGDVRRAGTKCSYTNGWYLTGTVTLIICTDDRDGLAPDWCSYANWGISLPRIRGDQLNDEAGFKRCISRCATTAGTTCTLTRTCWHLTGALTQTGDPLAEEARRIRVIDSNVRITKNGCRAGD